MSKFFFIQTRNSEICILSTCFTVRMNVCMYLHMCLSIQGKKAFHFTLSFSPFTLILLGPLIKSFKPFYPLNDILK